MKKDESKQIADALIRATRPKTFTYPLTLLDGTEIDLPCHICSHIMGLQAQKGIPIVSREEGDPYDPSREIDVWIRRANIGINGGYKFVDDSECPRETVIEKEIPDSMVTTEDWNALPEMLFPGAEHTRKSAKERRDAILRHAK